MVACVQCASRSYFFVGLILAIGQKRSFWEVMADLGRMREIAETDQAQMDFGDKVIKAFWTPGWYRHRGLLSPLLPPKIRPWEVLVGEAYDHWEPFPSGHSVIRYCLDGVPIISEEKYDKGRAGHRASSVR